MRDLIKGRKVEMNVVGVGEMVKRLSVGKTSKELGSEKREAGLRRRNPYKSPSLDSSQIIVD